jgi:hypothetical protein
MYTSGSFEEIGFGLAMLATFYLGWLLVGYIANAKH